MVSSKTELHDFLLDFRNPTPEEDTFHPDVINQVQSGLGEFLSILGYESDSLFNNITVEIAREGGLFPETVTFDVIAARSANSPPYLAVGTVVADDEDYEDWVQRLVLDLKEYSQAINAHYTVLFSNSCIFIRKPDGEIHGFRLSKIETTDSARIHELLSAPDVYPHGYTYPAAYHPDQTKLTQFLFAPEAVHESESFHHLEGEHFRIDLREYSEYLYEAEQAQDSNRKGECLENLAAILFNGVPCLSIRDRNLVTKFGEIDLVIEYQGAEEQTLFDYHTRFCLVECKHWVDPVPAKEIGHFESKCTRTNVDLGIVFAWNGISGEKSGKHARRMIDKTPKENPDVIVFNSRDLYRVLDGTGLYNIIDQKLYQQRFDL